MVFSIYFGFFIFRDARSSSELVSYMRRNQITLWGCKFNNSFQMSLNREFNKKLLNKSLVLAVKDDYLRAKLLEVRNAHYMQSYGMMSGVFLLVSASLINYFSQR